MKKICNHKSTSATHDRERKGKRYERNGGVKMNHELKEHSCPNKYSLNICYKLFLI